MIIVIKIKLSKLGTNHSPKRKSEVDIMEKRSAFESLNTVKQGVKPDQTIICLLDCGMTITATSAMAFVSRPHHK